MDNAGWWKMLPRDLGKMNMASGEDKTRGPCHCALHAASWALRPENSDKVRRILVKIEDKPGVMDKPREWGLCSLVALLP